MTRGYSAADLANDEADAKWAISDAPEPRAFEPLAGRLERIEKQIDNATRKLEEVSDLVRALIQHIG